MDGGYSPADGEGALDEFACAFIFEMNVCLRVFIDLLPHTLLSVGFFGGRRQLGM